MTDFETITDAIDISTTDPYVRGWSDGHEHMYWNYDGVNDMPRHIEYINGKFPDTEFTVQYLRGLIDSYREAKIERILL